MFTSVQFILLPIIIFGLSRVFLRVREKVIGYKVALFWSILWVAAGIVVIIPRTTTYLAEKLGVGRGVDIIVYLSLVLLFYLVFRTYVMMEDIRQEITVLIRKLAIEKVLEKKKKRKK